MEPPMHKSKNSTHRSKRRSTIKGGIMSKEERLAYMKESVAASMANIKSTAEAALAMKAMQDEIRNALLELFSEVENGAHLCCSAVLDGRLTSLCVFVCGFMLQKCARRRTARSRTH
jgi:hypothetical protein